MMTTAWVMSSFAETPVLLRSPAIFGAPAKKKQLNPPHESRGHPFVECIILYTNLKLGRYLWHRRAYETDN
jgi:hypothetical protein